MVVDPQLRIPIAISFGAIAGALSRYYLSLYLSLWLTDRLGMEFPYGTFLINITGCAAMGLFSSLTLERSLHLSPEIRLMVTTGFLGAYTTFSTYGLEMVNLWRNGSLELAGLYGVGSVILGAIATYLGMVLGKIL
jgi:fluoride exporter